MYGLTLLCVRDLNVCAIRLVSKNQYIVVRMQINCAIFHLGLHWVIASSQTHFNPSASPQWEAS